MMKIRSPKYSPIGLDQTSQNIIATKYFNHKLNKSNNISSYIQKRSFPSPSPSPSNNTIETEIDKSNENNKKYNIKLRPAKLNPNENKGYYETGSFTHNQKDSIKPINNIIRIN